MNEQTKEKKLMLKPEIEVVELGNCNTIATSGCQEVCLTDKEYICNENCSSNACTSDDCDSQSPCNDNCLSAGTKVTMADGSVKLIEEIKVGDMIMTFDHLTGKLVGNEVYVAYKSEEPKASFTLHFADGNELSMIGAHDLLEKESMKYVVVKDEEAESYIGHHFYNADSGCFVELVSVSRDGKPTDYYCLYTNYTYNCIANGMLNVADDCDFMLNIFELDESLKADDKALAADIAKYGVYKFENASTFSYDRYKKARAQFFNLVVGKGLKTQAELDENLADYYDNFTSDTDRAENRISA